MFRDFGQRMRVYRNQSNVTLMELAYKLGVSKSYLSKLENGKTTTIKLTNLQLLHDELNLFPNIPNEWRHDNISLRLLRANQQLHSIYKQQPHLVESILTNLEQNIQLQLDNE
ncbi:MAG: helix-turn-helix domain-containing protein [Bacillota bacterium]|jgi:transcriptional regulator with XRE-family HTH domain|uniref:helix-turn-helix domain-containing protein n=1 Tax=unclassified Fictibacillus TaxID=2644029 RepID=UPI0018CE8AFD|nr:MULTISPECIES: helix-turn-helix transcriptional regulator [unclassified Fictibacillus]MBH0157152.1 helix-turn-helix transcriptional regulator [Fictibacillus sp. 5RED26]MBH0163728.1 helix-turn-helix transcriptional regulator [Fictibacillus sp. 7GRE50]MBH0169646.1 helix-turn-helix transcriptional regulator [Fictibacillus sp. 18YEL24]MBH0174146.1 helix-turn-helix transcriptional regulator [Fictibacillus sp. 23RED33]